MMRAAPPSTLRTRAAGFTLIEVLIVVAIVGILAAVAVPSYSAYMTKARRTDATIFLMEAAGEQVRHHSENRTYADDLAKLGYGSATMVTPEGHYTVRVKAQGADEYVTRYELEAVPVTGGPQAGDTDCAAIGITSTGVKKPASADCW